MDGCNLEENLLEIMSIIILKMVDIAVRFLLRKIKLLKGTSRKLCNLVN